MGDVLCCLALKKRAKNRQKRQQSKSADDSSDDGDVRDTKINGVKETKNYGAVIMSEDVKKKIYYTAEFEAVGDVTKSGNLTCHEFYRLMGLLRYPNGRAGGKQLWHSCGKSEGQRMTLSEYMQLMDEGVEVKTCIWRNMFGEFDWNGNGFASKDEVLRGLEKIGLSINDKTRKMVDDMDDDNDGRVSYTDFLKEQLKLE